MVDEVAVPDRLEQAVGEAERQDVLRRLLAQEMIDPEDLVLGEVLVKLLVQDHGTLEVRAERLFHDDPAIGGQFRLGEQPNRRQRRAGWHAQIVDEPALPTQRLTRAPHRGL